MRRMPSHLAAAAAAATLLAACGGPETDITDSNSSNELTVGSGGEWIYRNAMVSPWQDWSWATRNLANTSPVTSGKRSIAVTYGAWQGLYFRRSAPVSSGKFAALILQVNGGNASGAALQARAVLADDTWTSGVNLGPTCTGGSIPANKWTTCTVSLSSIAPSGSNIVGIVLQESAGKSLPKMYFDEIGLQAAGTSTVAVSVAPATASVGVGATAQFSATVTGSANTAVTWSVQEGAAGGSVGTNGLYTAPSTAGTYHVVATSQADTTRSATATVTVTTSPPPQTVSVTIAPTTASVATGQTRQFTATVTGSTNTSVSWTVQEGAAGGGVSSTGLYTAPSTAGTYHVVATSQADSTKSATATVTVTSTPPPTTCLGSDLLASLGKTKVMVGFSDSDATAALAPWDFRYLYLAGPLGYATSCSSANGNWWGCWQDWSQPPGQYVTNFINTNTANNQIAMFTYYLILQASGASEGAGVVAAAKDASLMSRYFTDWRFLLTTIGSKKALLHVEPDFWGFAEQVNSNPHLIPAAVASANSTDCAGYENSIAGMGQCMIAMARKYAPNVKVGLHASAWGSGVDVSLNTSSSFNVAGEAAKVASFLVACGASSADFVGVEASDRDAGYYQSIGRNTWWDATNATLPNFTQMLTWWKAVAETVGKPLVGWQMPVGNMNQNNTTDHWKDNRVQYFFDHPDEWAAAHVAGIAFGSGAGGQTSPSTDGGYLVNRAKTYASSGGTALCP